MDKIIKVNKDFEYMYIWYDKTKDKKFYCTEKQAISYEKENNITLINHGKITSVNGFSIEEIEEKVFKSNQVDSNSGYDDYGRDEYYEKFCW